MVISTIRVRIPERVWFGPFSRRHPSLEMEVMSRAEAAPGISVSDVWIGGGVPREWPREIGRMPGVLSVDCLCELGSGYVYRVHYPDPPIVRVYRELGLPIQFPLRVHDGNIFWEVAARSSDFRKVMKFIGSADPHASILSIRRRRRRNHMPELTERQQRLLTRAMAEGYFAVPRAISLRELARKLGKSKSSISESLAVIEQWVLESAVRPTPAFA